MNASELTLIPAGGMMSSAWWGYRCGKCRRAYVNTVDAETCCRKQEVKNTRGNITRRRK